MKRKLNEQKKLFFDAEVKRMNSTEVLHNWKYLSPKQKREVVEQQRIESMQRNPEHYE